MEVLIFLLVVLTIITLIGHGSWVAIRAIVRALLGGEKKDEQVTRLFEPVKDPLNDLAATERQLVRFYSDGTINDETYERLLARIRAERDGLLGRQTKAPPKPTPAPAPAPAPVIASFVATDDKIVIKPVPTFIAPEVIEQNCPQKLAILSFRSRVTMTRHSYSTPRAALGSRKAPFTRKRMSFTRIKLSVAKSCD